MPKVSRAKLAERAATILKILGELYPHAECALHHGGPFQLLAATILSAQCTDERVNMVTPALFARFPDAHAMAAATQEELEELVKTTGFFRNKAKSLKGMAEALVRDYGGAVPGNIEALVLLPGVGRKTANVVLGECFGVPGLTIDTHMQRLNQRFGLTKNTDPEKIERDLMLLFPQEMWTTTNHRIITHGRSVCDARRPRCEVCAITEHCDYFAKLQKLAEQDAQKKARKSPDFAKRAKRTRRG